MMYMDDAVAATIQIMETNPENIKVRSSYNLAAMSFTPEEVKEEIKRSIPKFEVSYHADYRQTIADSWPRSIDDSEARKDWGWKHQFDLKKMSENMLYSLKKQYDLL